MLNAEPPREGACVPPVRAGRGERRAPNRQLSSAQVPLTRPDATRRSIHGSPRIVMFGQYEPQNGGDSWLVRHATTS